MKNAVLFFLAIFLFSSCTEKKWERSDNGVIIRLNDRTGKGARLIRLEPVSDRIIRVVASPGNTFSKENSLCVLAQPAPAPDYEVTQTGDSVTVTTKEIKASASVTTGAVTFRDKNDKVLLRESEVRGKSFSPFSVEGTDGYSLHQIFDSPPDEAFYGLGQHQSDEFNYKGLNESLYQYNTKVSVPFVV